MKYRINETYFLQFYGCDQGIHMMVYEDSQPLTCKKERLKPMRDFLAQEQCAAFKGGLRLEKNSDCISIIAKRNCIGSVPASVFESAINSAKSLPYYTACSQT
mgnify:CR=1 FL=1